MWGECQGSVSISGIRIPRQLESAMKTVLRKLAWAVALTALAFATVACGGSPTAPDPSQPPPSQPPNQPPPPVVVYASPPTGVSAEVWRVGFFMSDGKLRRPDAVHIILPDDASQDARDNFAAVVAAVNQMGFQTPVDLIAAPNGATFTVSVVPGLTCSGGTVAAACTALSNDSIGRITGGTMKFAFASFMGSQAYATVMHEVFRTMGVAGGESPKPGIMASSPSGTAPTAEELAMLRGRYNYPLLAVYAAQ